MRVQTSIASLVTSLALLAEPVSAADKTCGQTRSTYDSLMIPHLSQTDVELWYKIPFSTCSTYGLEFSTSLTREIPKSYKPSPVETTTRANIFDILENTWNVHVYKKSGKDTYGFGVGRGGIWGRFEEKNRWVTTSFEFRITPKKANLALQFTFQ